MTRNSDEALSAALASLEADPLLRDETAGKRGLRFNLMCEMGYDVLIDDNVPSEKWEHHFTGQHPEHAIELAEAGDVIAHEALCDVAEHLNHRGRVVPTKLQQYVIAAARKGHKASQGRHRITNIYRDEAIFRAVKIVTDMGIPATRNDDGKRAESGCSIVAVALARCGIKMKEAAVVSIWEKRRRARHAAGLDRPKRASR